MQTADGRTFRAGVLFRSDELSRLSAGDLVKLQGLGIELICDLRSLGESQKRRPRLPDASIRVVNVPIHERATQDGSHRNSGALRAGREGMDLFGVLVVAAVTAIGGGTVRDLLLGEPVYWLSNVTYLYVIAVAAACTLVYTRFRRPPHGALLVADAFGLAVFAVLGVRVGLGAGVSPLVAVIIGAITCVVGGAVLDVLCGETT